MQIDKLKEMSPSFFRTCNGRPEAGLTDKRWQEELSLRKLYITPYSNDVRKMGRRHSRDVRSWDTETDGAYQGMTNWQQYCSYINSVLETIRKGECDYCYYKYQIMDLLRFHYNSLRTKYCDGYWEVWLER